MRKCLNWEKRWLLSEVVQLKRIIDGGPGAKLLAIFSKKSYFDVIGLYFAPIQRSPFERTKFLTFESQLKS